jgi:hypothetical protein
MFVPVEREFDDRDIEREVKHAGVVLGRKQLTPTFTAWA